MSGSAVAGWGNTPAARPEGAPCPDYDKTATAIAALELNNRWPALVLCPNHMPHKWRRELETASDPADPIQARHITRPARAESSWFARRIAPVLDAYNAELTNDERWQVSPISDNDTGGRRRLTIKVDAAHRQDCLRRLEQAMLIKAGRQISQRPRVQLTLEGFTIEGLDRDDYTLADFFRDCAAGAWRIGARANGALDASFDEDILVDEATVIGGAARVGDKVLVRYTLRPDGALYAREIRPCVPKSHVLADDELIVYVRAIRTRLGRKAVAIVTFDPAKYDAGPLPVALPQRWTTVHYEANGKTKHVRAKAPACPVCGGLFGVAPDGELVGFLEKGPAGREVHVVLPDRCPHLHQEPVLDERGQMVKTADGAPLLATRPCSTPLYTMTRWRRVGLARLVQRKYAHRFQVYIADEVHEAKSADTDIGVCDGRLLSGIRSSLALTGTLFGGTASSLFYLLYRRNPEVRQLYDYKDVDQWVDHYGLWKHQWDEAAEGTERGASSGITRWNVRPPQELPGVSPGVARFLLPITLFGKITDLGYQLPPLHDRVDLVGMGSALEPHYKGFSEKLLKKAIQRLRQDRDPGLLTVWFATCRYRPMSAFRDEAVIYQGEPILPLPAIVFDERGHLPKEQRLAELVKASRACGRKTLVFVEQTGTRDIRGRLVETLGRLVPGVNVQTLSAADMKPAKRELWIKRHAPALDVLLVNAGLVKTGLDLVMFNDLVFYETNTSLYTVWQSMRRVWRLGQQRHVTTTFLAYRGAMEAQLLDLMGEKMKAAMLLYGDDAAGALVDTDTDEDLARELIRRALDGKTIEAAGDINGQSLFGSEPVGGEVPTEVPQAEPLPVPDWPMPEPVSPAEAIGQLSLFGGLVAVEVKRRRR